MRRLKNNEKGYTLVELLVAMAIFVIVLLEVYSVMANSSTIYRKGGYEVQLQSEAQQVILQLEDIMMDCNGSISYDEATKVLTVSDNVYDPAADSNTAIIYTVKYVPADVSVGQYFGMLTYEKTGMTGGAIPLADYVEDFSVDMSGYSNDNVTLNIKLANEDYSYSASEDVYLRNEIGSGGKGEAQNTSSAKKFLDVKRYEEISLAKLYDETIDGYKYDYTDFYFKDGSGNKKYETDEYDIDTNTWSISINSTHRGESTFDDEYGPYLMYATGKKTNLSTGAVETLDESKCLLISTHTDKVSWGFDSYSYYFLAAGSTSFASTGYTPVTGISLAGADKVTYDYVIQTPTGYHYDATGVSPGTTVYTFKTIEADKTEHDGYPSSKGYVSKVIFFADPGQIGYWNTRKDSDNSLRNYQCRVDRLYSYVDVGSNSVACSNCYNKSYSVWDTGMCYNFIKDEDGGFLKDKNRFYIHVNVYWKHPASHSDFKIYLYPSDRSLTDGQRNLLIDQVK